MDLFRPILDQIAKLWARLDKAPTIRWGTVTQASPLLVTLDGDFDRDGNPVVVSPQTVVATIALGKRALCVEQHRRVIVIAVAD